MPLFYQTIHEIGKGSQVSIKGGSAVYMIEMSSASQKIQQHGQIYSYKPPSWAANRKVIPRSRAKVSLGSVQSISIRNTRQV